MSLIISGAASQSKSQGRGRFAPNLAVPLSSKWPPSRRRYFYLLSVRSSLVSPETATGLLWVFAPSCQPTTLYWPSGTFSIL